MQMMSNQSIAKETSAWRKLLSGLNVDSSGRVTSAELQSYGKSNPEATELIERILQNADAITGGRLFEWGELFDAAVDWKRRQPEELRSRVRARIAEMRLKTEGMIHLAELKKSFPM